MRRSWVVALVLATFGAACDAPLAPAAPTRTVPATAAMAASAPATSAEPVAPAPVASTAPAPPAVPLRRPGAYANLDPADDYTVGPPDELPDCEEELAHAGVTFRASTLPVHTEHKGKIVCGAPQVVVYRQGPGKIAYDPPPLLTCSMALALASFERILQEEAVRLLRSPVVQIQQLGTYNCREMAAYPGWVSEHAYANAIDLARFTLKNGTAIRVMGDFDVAEGEPKRTAGVFLREVSRRAYDEDVFSTVLTPFFDAHHRDHFHLDLARYRSDGTRPES
ncbi:MAG TPA: extensin family protein [Polyangiaceae bacterium]